MKILLLASAALVIQLFVFVCMGSVALHVRGKNEYSLSRAALLGYLVYFGIFEVVCVACEVALLPLRTLALIMAVIMGVAILLGLYTGYRSWTGAMNSLRYRLSLHGPLVILMLAALAASVVFVILYTDASADSGWYVGTASTALATDTIGRFDPSTGGRLLTFKARYALNAYPFHSAVICSLIKGLPVIVQMRSVMSAINMLMSFIAVYELGLALFPDHEEKREKVQSIRSRKGSYSRRRADLLVIVVTVINLFSSTIYMPGIFLYTRSFEGKALITNIVIAVVLACCVRLWRETDENAFRTLFWAMAAGVCFSASSIMALVLALAGILPLIAAKGKWKLTIPLVCSISPVLVWGAVYYLIQHGVIVLRTWR